MKYRKKPVIIEAFQIGTEYPDWFMEEVVSGRIKLHAIPPIEANLFRPNVPMEADIETLEGTMHASAGDFIIKGVNGEIYPCKPEIFDKTYEPVTWHE